MASIIKRKKNYSIVYNYVVSSQVAGCAFGIKTSHCFQKGKFLKNLPFSSMSKSLAEFRVRRRESSLIVFSGGMYVGKSITQLANVLARSASALRRAASLFKKASLRSK